MADSGTGAFGKIGGWEVAGIVALLVAVIGLGVATEIHSAFLKRRQTDLDTYLRAAWAVRTGGNMYSITDTNGWHYNYPPLLGILLVPLADAPRALEQHNWVPFSVSVGLWYVLSVVLAWIGTDRLARALEKTSGDAEVRLQRRYCRRWWALRLLPLLICLPALARALARGQVNSLLLLLLALTGASLAYRRYVRAGLWTGLAAAVKVFPLFLGLYWLWRWSWRGLLGVLLGLVVGGVLVPVVTMGPQGTWAAYGHFAHVVIAPALGLNHNASRDVELFDVNHTDSNSYEAIINHMLHPGHNPPMPSRAVKVMHWLISLALVAATLLVERRSRVDHPLHRNLFFGCLIAVLLPMIPICHPHYFCLTLPLVVTLMAVRWERDQKLPFGWPLLAVLWFVFAAHIITVLPHARYFRNFGLVTFADLALWGAGIYWMANFRRRVLA
ncbi:MAG: DUF2029 domain-containing protein [Phycisphaerales bacterium]|nr:DUF2029 domain-containing protein [Phycisphaerales bacterium]